MQPQYIRDPRPETLLQKCQQANKQKICCLGFFDAIPVDCYRPLHLKPQYCSWSSLLVCVHSFSIEDGVDLFREAKLACSPIGALSLTHDSFEALSGIFSGTSRVRHVSRSGSMGIRSVPERPRQCPGRCSRGRPGPAPPARVCGCAAGPGGGAAGGWERGRERHVSLHQAPQHLPVRQERRRRH